MRLTPTLRFIILLSGLTGAVATMQHPASGSAAPRSIAIQNVDVITMTSATPLLSANVLVRNGQIVSLNANAEELRSATVRVDGAGSFLIPGLTDAHVHLPTSPALSRRVCDLLIANGITTVFELGGSPAQLKLRDDIRTGKVRGPRIYVSGPPLGDPHGLDTTTSPDYIEREVLAQKRAGYDFIKLHGDLSRAAYRRLNSVARQNLIRLVGHAPRNLGVQAMLDERQEAVAHIEEYLYAYFYFRKNIRSLLSDVDTQTRLLATRTARAGTTVISTLEVFRGIPQQISNLDRVLSRHEVQYIPKSLGDLWGWWPPHNSYTSRFGRDTIPWFERQYRIMMGIVSAFHDAGVPLLAGTDTPTAAVVPGFSLHDELRQMVIAGLSPYEALKTATVNPATFMQTSSEAGTIEVGRRADMILLSANPLEDINRTRQIKGVLVNGEWYSKERLMQLVRPRQDAAYEANH